MPGHHDDRRDAGDPKLSLELPPKLPVNLLLKLPPGPKATGSRDVR
ncbi:MAG: hypothetical protein L0G22_10235 [Propionibacteriaceae bacterium]|nr:hypothetical protein [Propionibacteriaceae bacterium]